MKALTFTINLLEPLLATGLEGDPNAGVSLNHIAGSALRGAIIGLYLREKISIDANDKTCRDLFFDNKIHFLNSYPQITFNGEAHRSFPTPFAWQKVKGDDEKDFYNFAVREKEGKTAYKNVGFPYFVFSDSSKNAVKPFTPKYRLAVHTQRDAAKGRSTSDDGAVFRYESIAEKTKFGGAIICEDENAKLLKSIKELIERNKIVVFGGSRSAGYGKAEFCNFEIIDDWQEFEAGENDANEISIYLLSNVIVRDANGSFKSLLTAKDFGLENVTEVKEKTFVRTEIVGGFNQKWGLPMPQMLSIKAGSIFTFKSDQKTSTAELEKLIKKGIGEKLNEGFGRIGFNLTGADSLKELDEEVENVSDKNIKDSKIRDRILDGILRQKLNSQLVVKIDGFEIKGTLSNSQISRLRMFIRELRTTGNADPANLENFYKDLKKSGKNQFESVNIGGKQFISWTKENHFETPWNLKLAGKETTSEHLQNEFNLLLIDGVLAKKAKERK